MGLVNYEKCVARDIVLSNKLVPPIYDVVAKVLYSNYLDMIRNKVCPWCGRKFTTRRALYLHLNRKVRNGLKCYIGFQTMVKDIVETVRKAHYMIRVRKHRGKTMYLVRVENPHPRFDTREEAIRYLVVNGYV